MLGEEIDSTVEHAIGHKEDEHFRLRIVDNDPVDHEALVFFLSIKGAVKVFDQLSGVCVSPYNRIIEVISDHVQE